MSNYFLKFPIKNAWKTKLTSDFPDHKFHLILSFDGKESILRFYKYRENEGFWVKINDLDGYKEEAILVMVI